MNKNNKKRIRWMIPLALMLIVIGGWGTIFLSKGRPKIIAWWFIQIISLIGISAIVITIIIIVKDICKYKKVTLLKVITLLIFFFVAWPASWYLGLTQIAYPVDVNTIEPSITISLPFKETAIVGWGGDKLENNYHVTVPGERWAYDLLMEPAGIGSNKLKNYGIYGKEVIAPASGIVVSILNSEPDITPGIPDETSSLTGNHIFMRLDETGTYLVLAHLMKDSILVEEGQHIKEGMVIAKVGNSGNSSEPHLHIHHQRENPATTHILLSEGLPLYFKCSKGQTMPNGGVRVENGRDIPIGDRIVPIKGKE